MVYITGDGTVHEKNDGIIAKIITFFTMILLFFQTLLGLDSSTTRDSNEQRDYLRRSNPSGGGRWDGPALGGGNEGGGGVNRRPMGRLSRPSGIAPPPMGGGCCGGGCPM